MSANKRVFFNGPAGTGKTLLAVEQVRRMLLAGKKVLLVCFNIYLGKMLQLEVNKYDADASSWAGTLHGYFFDVIKRSGLLSELEKKRSKVADNQFYAELCPEYFKKAVEIVDLPRFDCLVVDEAQDLLCENYVDSLENVISGGFAEGQWYIFYDSNNQEKLYNKYDPDLVEKLKSAGAAEYSLDLNCRNTENVAIHTAVVSGFKMAETKIKSGHKIEYLWYDNLNHQAQMLSEYLKKILAGGVKPNEITILYPGGAEEVKKSILSVKAGCALEELTPERIEKPDENIINVASVQAYKGLEDKVVILVGIDKMGGAWINTLNYVGMSRARDLLCISLDKDIRSEYNKKVMEILMPKDNNLKD
jgi:plastocyanin